MILLFKRIILYHDVSGTLVVKMTADSNQNALDGGLDGVIIYFDRVDPSCSLDILERVANNVIEKAMGSKPSTISKAKVLMQILIEVHEPSAVVPILLTKLSDKKPKIPPACMELILDGIASYGASKFPIKDILKCMPNALNGTNAPLRDIAMRTLVEIHRWIGIAPLSQIVDGLRPAQKTDFEKQIGENSEKPFPTKLLRSDKAKGVVLTRTTTVESDAREFVDEVDIAKRVKGTEFANLLTSEKWVDQNQALQILIDCIGPTPKIKPSSYIHDILKPMHEFLKTGHLQVQVKVLKVIALLADGLRGKFTQDIRPMMSTILSKTKEKKICSEVEATCITLFRFCVTVDGQVEDMVDILSSKKNPPHAKTSIAIILQTLFNLCIGNVSNDNLKLIAEGLISNSEDSDPKVRDDSAKCLAAMCKCEKFQDYSQLLLRQLKAANPKLHKKVYQEMEAPLEVLDPKKSSKTVTALPTSTTSMKQSGKLDNTVLRSEPSRVLESTSSSRVTQNDVVSSKAATVPAKKKASTSEGDDLESIEELNQSPDDAVDHLTNICSLDCSNISALLGSAKWQEKVDGIGLIKTFAESNEIEYKTLASCVTYFGQNTSNYKISNINVLKALIECFSVLLKSCKDGKSCRSIILKLCDIVADKFGDKKIQSSVEDMLDAARIAVGTPLVIKKLNKTIESSKSPAVQQSYLNWLKDMVHQNGVADFPVLSTVPMLLKALENKNATIRTASIETLGALYSNLGPPLLSFLNQKELSPQLRSTLDAEFQRVGYTPSENKSSAGGSDALPRKDILEIVDKNVIIELNITEGKDSWQVRRAALEKVLAACEASGHYLDYGRSTSDFLRVLKARLYDTQSNLKPLATAVLSHFIVSLEPDKAVKILKQCAAPILEGLVDNKKQMRDATIVALNLLVTFNSDQIDKNMFSTVVSLCGDVLNNTTGRQEMIPWLLTHKDYFSGDWNDLVPHFIGCLQDKVALVRSGSEGCLNQLLARGNISKSTIDRMVMDMPPAGKRAIQGTLDRLGSTSERSVSDMIVQHQQQNLPTVQMPEKRQEIHTHIKSAHPLNVTNVAVKAEPMNVATAISKDVPPFESDELEHRNSTNIFQPTKSVADVVTGISWPPNPKGEDFLGLLAEWQSIRSHRSLEILFGDFNSDEQIEQELSSIITSAPEELPLVAYWLMYHFISYNNPSRLIVFGKASVKWIKAISQQATIQQCCVERKVVQSVFSSFVLCYGRSNNGEGALHQCLQEFTEEMEKIFGSKFAFGIIFQSLDIANTHCKEFCADSLIWLVMNEGIIHCTRAQILQLFQYLNIEVKLATASLKAKWKVLVECILLKVGDFPRLSTILKWEPKELFFALNIPLVNDIDMAQLQIARGYVQSIVSKVYVAIDVLSSSTVENAGQSFFELVDLLRKLHDTVAGNKEVFLDGKFFLRTAKVTIPETPCSSQIVALVVGLFVGCANNKEFLQGMPDDSQESLLRMMLLLLVHYERKEQIKHLVEVMISSFCAQSSCAQLLNHVLSIIDAEKNSDSQVANIGTKLLLHKVRAVMTDSPLGGEQLIVQLLDNMGAYFNKKADKPNSLRSANAIVKMLADLIGNSVLHKSMTKATLARDSILRSMVVKIVSSSDSDGLNTELVSIIKEVTIAIDKVEAVRKLYNFKQSNPHINVDLHLLKLSSAFRNFVEETMIRLAAEEKQNINGFSISKVSVADENNQNASTISQTEAFRLIHTLKKLPSQGLELEESSYNEPIREQ